MNIKKCITAIIIIIIIIVMNYNCVFASNNIDGDIQMNTGFEVKDYDNEAREQVLSAIGIKLITTDYKGIDLSGISCFDVNENGDIAVVYDTITSTKAHICIYNSYGEFQYGYSFVNYGMAGVEWDGENVITYSVRGDRLMLLDRYANVLDMKKVLDTLENSKYSRKILWERERTVGDYTYKLKKGKITKTDAEGNKQVIVDRSKNYNIHNLLMLLCFVVMATIVTIGLVKLLIQYRR